MLDFNTRSIWVHMVSMQTCVPDNCWTLPLTLTLIAITVLQQSSGKYGLPLADSSQDSQFCLNQAVTPTCPVYPQHQPGDSHLPHEITE